MAKISELTDFKLSDAVKFNDMLNPAIWQDEKLKPEVREQLEKIAWHFAEYLGVSDLKIEDITISGSNAAYTWTPHSDLDLHLLVDFNKLPNSDVYRELFNAKKILYNDGHSITVKGIPVELYVQDTNDIHYSAGEYSILNDDWVSIPKKEKPNFDEVATKLKYEKLGELIELALKSKDPKKVKNVLSIVKRYRKAGLSKTGEFGPENLAVKALRKQGLIQKLFDLKKELESKNLSIDEQLNETVKDPILSIIEIAQKHFGNNLLYGGNCGTFALALASILEEKSIPTKLVVICEDVYETEAEPEDILASDARVYHVAVYANKFLYDGDGKVTPDSIADWIEEEYRDHNPAVFNFDLHEPNLRRMIENSTNWNISTEKFYSVMKKEDINENSGYIPSEKEKNDPRFKTALTKDVRPNAIKKNAKAFGWKTNRAGIPPEAKTNGKLAEELMQKWRSFLAESSTPMQYINQEDEGGSLEGYVVDTDQPQLFNYLESQGADPMLAKKIAKKFQRIGIIRNMYVDEKYRNQGMGTDLVSGAINDAFIKGAQAILLVSDEGENNEFDLTKWYQGFGFKKIGMAGSDPVMLLTNHINEEQQEMFLGYEKQHREKQLTKWLQNTLAWDGAKPKILYHATTHHFDQFKTRNNKGFASVMGMPFEIDRHGAFFAEDPKFAEEFILPPEEWENPNPTKYKENAVVIPVYLSVQNPIDLTDQGLSNLIRNKELVTALEDEGIDITFIYRHMYEHQRWELFDGEEGARFIEALEKMGFDSAVFIEQTQNAKNGRVWVAFHPIQIKSAIGNRGSYSKDDPRITKESS